MSSAIAPSMKTKPQKDYTLGEEIFNAVTHGVGALLAIAAIPLCVVQAVTHGAGLVARGGAHLFDHDGGRISHVHALSCDRCASSQAGVQGARPLRHLLIYRWLLCPILPGYAHQQQRHSALHLRVGRCACRYRCRSVLGESPRWISALLYLMQGWAVVVCIPALWTLLDPVGFWLLVVGGICYTIGAVFYTCTKKKKYMHSVFHLWVLAGSIFQFFSIYLFVLA